MNNHLIILFILMFIINPICKLYLFEMGKKINNTKLHDILHYDNINIKKLSILSDIFALIIAMYLFYNYLQNKLDKNDTKLFIEYVIILIIIKIVLSSVTILPDASQNCIKNIKNKFNLIFLGGCHDLIFSLHMAMCLLFLYFLKKNSIINVQTCLFISIIQGLLIILSHNHYTIDVLLAYIVVPFVINGKYFI